MGERAIVYREKNHITKEIADGTAVNVVAIDCNEPLIPIYMGDHS